MVLHRGRVDDHPTTRDNARIASAVRTEFPQSADIVKRPVSFTQKRPTICNPVDPDVTGHGGVPLSTVVSTVVSRSHYTRKEGSGGLKRRSSHAAISDKRDVICYGGEGRWVFAQLVHFMKYFIADNN